MTTIPDQPRRKHILGFAIMTVIILIVLGQLKHMVVEHTYCEGEVPVPGQQTMPVNMEGAPDVVMLGTSWCPSCIAATQFFAANDINYCEYDIETSAIGERLYKDVNGREADTMSFFSRLGPLFGDNVALATGQLISYDVIQGGDEGELILLRSENMEFVDEIDEKEGMTLCDGLQEVKFTYYDDDGESHENWDSESEDFGGLMPRMVSVSLEFLNYENPDAPMKFMTSVVLPMQKVELQGEE
jgi:hypothetical protein